MRSATVHNYWNAKQRTAQMDSTKFSTWRNNVAHVIRILKLMQQDPRSYGMSAVPYLIETLEDALLTPNTEK